jgi:protein-S-isoprenylcysteine O-methyltransferase Ste14
MARRWDLAAILALSFPTPLYYAAGLTLGFILHLVLPIPLLSETLTLTIGLVLIVAGGALGGLAILAFRKSDTSLSAAVPSRALVLDGPYRRSRNPMYLSLAVLYAGFTFLLNAVAALLLLPLVIWLVQRRAIESEEHYLEQKFGDAYRQYKTRVRRWL